MPSNFSFKRYRLPLHVPLRTAHGVWSEREGLIVRLEDDAGRVGFGEIAPIPWFGTETVAGAEEVCRKLGAQVTPETLAGVPGRFGCVRFALGQACDQQCHLTDDDSLAAARLMAKRLPVAALLPAGAAAPAAMDERLAAGFLAFKWKVGVRPLDEELGLLDELLGRLPAYAKLRLDANGAWSVREAARWLARCADRPVEFVEQPVAAGEDDALLGLAHDYPVTLALDESVVRIAEAREWQGRGWPGVFVIKPALAGTLGELAGWIGETKADVVLSSAIETVLGRSAILRAALTQPLTQRALGFGTGAVFGDRRWDGPVLGPLADASSIAALHPETLWDAL